MLVPEALRYQTYKTCTLAFVGQMRQRRIWHKQSALCRQSEQSLAIGRLRCSLRYHANNQHNNQPNHGVDQLQQSSGFNVSLLTGQK